MDTVDQNGTSRRYPRLTSRQIVRFWLPLIGTWAMMAAEGPMIAAVIARLPDPKINLAAYGIAFSLALILEAPVIMMMTASTALVTDRFSYQRMVSFSRALNILVTCVAFLGVIPAVFEAYMAWFSISDDIRDLIYWSMVCLLAWPGMIGVRRFNQGVMIQRGQTQVLISGTFLRLTVAVLVIWLAATFTSVPGACIGAAALGAGASVEAIFIWLQARRVIPGLPVRELIDTMTRERMSWRGISKFYLPLAATSTIFLVMQPILNLLVSYCENPVDSLAVLPVIMGFVFLFRCVSLSSQEVIIALLQQGAHNLRPLLRFIWGLAGISAVVYSLVVLSPLVDIWLMDVSGLTKPLADLARLPLLIIGIVPLLSFALSWQKSIAVMSGKTTRVTVAVMVEVAVIITVMIVAVNIQAVGALAAACAYGAGRFSGTLLLTWFNRHLAREMATASVL